MGEAGAAEGEAVSRVFKPGDIVKVIVGPRAGEVTTVTSGLCHWACPVETCLAFPCSHKSIPCHQLDLLGAIHPGIPVGAPPAWLEPFWPGKEASDKTLAEILNSLKTKEPA